VLSPRVLWQQAWQQAPLLQELLQCQQLAFSPVLLLPQALRRASLQRA
jgi:hypothetical protein